MVFFFLSFVEKGKLAGESVVFHPIRFDEDALPVQFGRDGAEENGRWQWSQSFFLVEEMESQLIEEKESNGVSHRLGKSIGDPKISTRSEQSILFEQNGSPLDGRIAVIEPRMMNNIEAKFGKGHRSIRIQENTRPAPLTDQFTIRKFRSDGIQNGDIVAFGQGKCQRVSSTTDLQHRPRKC